MFVMVVFTIGASGAVMGVFTVYCLLFPEREVRALALLLCSR